MSRVRLKVSTNLLSDSDFDNAVQFSEIIVRHEPFDFCITVAIIVITRRLFERYSKCVLVRNRLCTHFIRWVLSRAKRRCLVGILIKDK